MRTSCSPRARTASPRLRQGWMRGWKADVHVYSISLPTAYQKPWTAASRGCDYKPALPYVWKHRWAADTEILPSGIRRPWLVTFAMGRSASMSLEAITNLQG